MADDELQHLIDRVVREVLSSRATHGRCTCHGMPADHCPARFARVVNAGAARAGGRTVSGDAGIAALIDHTLLRPDATRLDLETLCEEAREWRFATVCVNPMWVALCARLLEGSGVGVCAVVGFPLGATVSDVKAYEARRAIFDGASEIDMVIQVGALKAGELEAVRHDISSVTVPCREHGVLSKVIIEAALLTDEEKIAACTLAKAAGADYVKTSTGFGPGGATKADVELMRQVVGAGLGIKAAGGIRDLAQAKAMIAGGATRIGASAGVRIVKEAGGSTGALERVDKALSE
jgi:deoxyribose-phosphate aldolase